MRNYAKIFTLFVSICLLSSFKVANTSEISNNEINSYNSCEDLIQTWTGVLLGRTVHFNSRSCARNAGATNIQPGGLYPRCWTLTCA